MIVTVLLLGGEYVVLIAVLVAAGIGVVAVVLITAVALLVQYFSCERIALAAIRAREVDADEAPELHAIARRLCITANLPMPRLALVASALPGVYTVGRTPSTAVVCATSALLELLDDDELEAVLAHELTHILTRDVMVMTIASWFAAVAALVARIRLPGSGRDDDAAPPGFVVVIISGLVYMLSYVLVEALARHREFSADRGAAALTGRPEALRAALERISTATAQIAQRDLGDVSGEMAALAILAPEIEATVATLFATHPPLPSRLDALAQLRAPLPARA